MATKPPRNQAAPPTTPSRNNIGGTVITASSPSTRTINSNSSGNKLIMASSATAAAASPPRVTRSCSKKSSEGVPTTTKTMTAAAALNSQEGREHATSLTPALEESQISEDVKLEEEGVSLVAATTAAAAATMTTATNDNDDDVVMNDAAETTTRQPPSGGRNDDDNIIKVKLENEGGNNSNDNAMEVDNLHVNKSTEKQNISEGEVVVGGMGGGSSSNPATKTTHGENSMKQAGGEENDIINNAAAGGEKMASLTTATTSPTTTTTTVMTATANKLTGVRTTTATNIPPTTSTTTKPSITTKDDHGGGVGGGSSNNKNTTMETTTTSAAAGAGAETATPSFSMTLAIGPQDTQRVFQASKAFNVQIQLLQKRQNVKITKQQQQQPATNNKAEAASSSDAAKKTSTEEGISSNSNGAAGGDGTTTTKMDKKKPAIVHSPPSREEIPLKPPSYSPTTTNNEYSTTIDNGNPPTTTNGEGEELLGPQPLRNLLIPAAKATNDALIASFLRRLEDNDHCGGTKATKTKEQLDQEVQTCLLFFLDADKSTKLLAAFDVLSSSSNNSLGGEKKDGGGRVGGGGGGEEDDSATSKLVGLSGLIQLFQSFLTSISTCVHGDKEKKGVASSAPTTSPTTIKQEGSGDDWKGSDRTQKEILEVATFAAQNLIDFGKKEESGEGGGMVSFDIFGKWYNSGGFSLVPWLELLDLSKWDYTGNKNSTTNSAAAAAATPGGGQGQAMSSSKRARINEPLTPGISNMNEPIGSPTALFASGAMLGATPQTNVKSEQALSSVFDNGGGGGGVQSFSAMFGEMDESRTVVSFDFSGSSPNATGGPPSSKSGSDCSSSFHIDITEENLVMLRNLVKRTGFASLEPQQVEALMMKHARCERHQYGETIYVISRTAFGKFIREVVPKEASKRFDPTEIENFSNYFTNFFTCFDYSWSELKKDEVNAKELMVGFSFLFAGNKSSKLAAAYDMLDVDKNGYLTQRGLMQYLRSYLTMLAGISLLSANKRTTTQIRKRLMSPKRDDAFLAVENGAKWTLSHFLRAFESEHSHRLGRDSTRSNAVTFEDFAKWYTEGGYAVAPWLELLDLQKFLSLIGENASGKYPDPSNDPSLAEVLFTFPLANSHSLVVLRDDAQYVRSVVNELGLLSLTSEDIWSVLFNDVFKSLITASGKSSTKKSVRMEVDQTTFVQCMMRILSGTGKIKQHSTWSEFSPEETLKNFFLSFDLSESNRVALNQLMCGLTLLCGGKKSNKLAFAFGLFAGDDSGRNGKKKSSMTHNDFFFFFRSFLIVMFSCCNQSLSLTAESVTQYISDTAKSVADDVMTYWKAKKVDKVNFENFGEWYNEGGFETAPWLELLDLDKWVLADQLPPAQQQQRQQQQQQTSTSQPQQQHQQQSFQPQQKEQNQHANPPATPAPTKAAASASYTPGLTPGHEAIKALLASPKMKANGSSPDCPPAPPDDDPLFDLDMSAVDAVTDEMDFILQQESATSQGHVENVNYVDPAAAAGAAPSPPRVTETQNALKFNLLTHDQFGGYMISIGPDQVQLLHRIVTETGLYQIDAQIICRFILYDAKSRRQTNLSKKAFHSAMKRVFDYAFSLQNVSSSTQEEVSVFSDKLFTSFDQRKAGKINAVELACGFTVLCNGRKSDKLEHVFELLDEDKDTLVARQDITRFIQSFLVMLMSVSSSFTHLYGGACSNDNEAVTQAIEAGSEWATTQVFDALKPTNGTICFDDFADWYTKGGYQSMPWLELLDLRKWVLGEP